MIYHFQDYFLHDLEQCAVHKIGLTPCTSNRQFTVYEHLLRADNLTNLGVYYNQQIIWRISLKSYTKLKIGPRDLSSFGILAHKMNYKS